LFVDEIGERGAVDPVTPEADRLVPALVELRYRRGPGAHR
jgi:hypothetical protein